MVFKSIYSRFLIVIFSSLISLPAWSMRCGTDLVSKGDFDVEVYKKCGEPHYQSVIGYVLSEDGKREYQMERWIYEKANGALYILFFEGGKLKQIKWERNP